MKKRSLCFLLAVILLIGAGMVACKENDAVESSDGYIVTFNPNDRDAAILQVTVSEGEAVARPDDPVRQDYVFTGWYLNKQTKGAEYDFSTSITDDLFLYAGWQSTKVRVIFDWNYAGSESTVLSIDRESAVSKAQAPKTPDRENYQFLNWYADSSGTEAYDFSKILTKNTTIYAGWKQLRAVAAFDLGYFGAENVPESQVLDLTKGEKVAQPDDPMRGEEGDYLFEGWFVGTGKKEAAYDFNAEVTGDLTIHAKWTVLRALVTFDENYESSTKTSQKVNVGETAATPEAPSRTGYEFTGWYYDAKATAKADPATVSIADDTVFYAGWKAEPLTVTYNYNYDGAPAAETVNTYYDALVEEPAEPTKAGDEFIGWYLDANQTQPYTFGEPVRNNMTLYAGWSSKGTAPSGTMRITFYTNDGTGSVYKTEDVQANKYSEMRGKVTYPEREGYKAFGWYTTSDCTDGTEFNFNTRITANLSLYAKWQREFVFEAELTQLTDIPIGDTGKTEDKLGFGESSNPKGLYLIEWDSYGAGASNEYYVSYLYNPGSYLEFYIDAAADVKGATLVLRLTPELHDMFFLTGGPSGNLAEKDGYKVYVNPVYSFNSITNTEKLESYDQVFSLNYDLTGAVTKDEDPNYTSKRPFEDYEITTTLDLHAGTNIIRLVTDNTHDFGGSMHAAAPMVDCMKIYTDVELSWTPGKEYKQNLVGIDVRWPAKNAQ